MKQQQFSAWRKSLVTKPRKFSVLQYVLPSFNKYFLLGTTFYCSRGGKYTSRRCGKRDPPQKGPTSKLQSVCTATISVRHNIHSGTVEVESHLEHSGSGVPFLWWENHIVAGVFCALRPVIFLCGSLCVVILLFLSHGLFRHRKGFSVMIFRLLE